MKIRISLLLYTLFSILLLAACTNNIPISEPMPQDTPNVHSFMTQYGYVDITCDENDKCTGQYRESGQPATEMLVQDLMEQLVILNEERVNESLQDCENKTVTLYADLKIGLPDESKFEDWCLPTPDMSEMCGPDGCVTTGGYNCPGYDHLVQGEEANQYNIASYMRFIDKQSQLRIERLKNLIARHPNLMTQEELQARCEAYEEIRMYGLEFVMDLCDYPQFIKDFGNDFRKIEIFGIEELLIYPACESPLNYEILANVSGTAAREHNWKTPTSTVISSAEAFSQWVQDAMFQPNGYINTWWQDTIDTLKQRAETTDFSQKEWIIMEGGSQPTESWWVSISNACGSDIDFHVIACNNTLWGAQIGYPVLIAEFPKGDYHVNGGFHPQNCTWDGIDGVIQYHAGD